MSRFDGKLFSVLGDSMSTFEGYMTPGYPSFYTRANQYRTGVLSAWETWWGRVVKHFDGELLANNSWSGSTVTRLPGCLVESYGCSETRCASLGTEDIFPDHIFVFMGANDRGYDCPVTADATGDSDRSADISVFPDAYGVMLDRIRANYPGAEVWCMTIPRTGCTVAPDMRYPAVLSDAHTVPYNEAMKDAARARGCHVIDLFACAEKCDTCDALHPNYRGMQTLAEYVIAVMEATEI